MKHFWELLFILFTPLGIPCLTACNNLNNEREIETGRSAVAEHAAVQPTATALLPVITQNEGKVIWQPAPGTSWQWQLTGEIDTSFDVTMYDIDLFDAPQEVIDNLHSDGRIVICYFSAGSWEEWRQDAHTFPASLIGNPLEGWPDERWLDIRQIDLLAPIMAARLELAASKQCDGVEPDNVTAYHNDTGFPITAQDQLVYNLWLAEEAHARGLSIGLKNDLEQIPELVDHFDWALNEECYQYDECDLLLLFVQAEKAVFGVEYEGDPGEFCPYFNQINFDWLYKRWDLDAWRVGCR